MALRKTKTKHFSRTTISCCFSQPACSPPGASPAFLAVQQTAVGADLSLQLHLGVQQLAVALPLGGQPAPHLLQLALQPADHLGEVLQLAGVELLRALQRVLQAFLLGSRRQLCQCQWGSDFTAAALAVLMLLKGLLVKLSRGMCHKANQSQKMPEIKPQWLLMTGNTADSGQTTRMLKSSWTIKLYLLSRFFFFVFFNFQKILVFLVNC